MSTQSAKGKTYVATERSEALNTRPLAGNMIQLSNGQRVQVKRYWSAAVIATGASAAEIIPAPASGHYIAVMSYQVTCSAATTVSFVSDSVVVEAVLLCSTGIPVGLPRNGSAHFRGAVDANIGITTSGGNTSVRMEYIEVPLDVDIL